MFALRIMFHLIIALPLGTTGTTQASPFSDDPLTDLVYRFVCVSSIVKVTYKLV